MKYAIVYVICIVCLFGVGVLVWRIARPTPHSERGSTMTLQTLVESWKTSGAYNSVEDPATEADIKKAEAIIGAQLPTSLREVYPLFNGGWTLDLDFFPLDASPDEELAVTNANELFIEWGWHIPKEIRLFAGDGGEEVFGIWLPETANPIYNHPIIEVGELPAEEGCMGIAGTNLLSFLRGWSAYYLMEHEIDALNAVEEGESANRLIQIQTALSMLQVPQHLLREPFYEVYEERFGSDPMSVWSVDHHFSQLRKWADPQLPDPYGDSYNQRYTIADLKRIFGESK